MHHPEALVFSLSPKTPRPPPTPFPSSNPSDWDATGPAAAATAAMMYESPAASPGLPRRQPPFVAASRSAPSFSSLSPNNTRTSRRLSLSGAPAGPSSSAAASSSSFSQNGRIALALVPAALFLLDLGGSPVAAAVSVGLLSAYVLDLLRLPPAAPFFAVWLSLLAGQLVFLFSASPLSFFPSLPLSLLALALCALQAFFVGVWASLNFRWIQIEGPPAVVLALERLLFACVPLAAPPLFAWASVAALGLGPASAYCLAAFSAVFFYLFSLPRPSSFKIGGGTNVLGPLESCVHTLNLLFLPVAFHVAARHSTLLSSAASVADLLLLFFLPFLFLLYASTRGALWWVSADEQQIQKIRVVNGTVALFVVVICLEVRVVFHSFSRYLQVPPPLNYILVTVALLGGGAAVGSYAVGLVEDAFSSNAFTALAILVSGAGALVIGLPLLVCHFHLTPRLAVTLPWNLKTSSLHHRDELPLLPE